MTEVAGAAALLFSWLRSATNTVHSVEDWGEFRNNHGGLYPLVSSNMAGWKIP